MLIFKAGYCVLMRALIMIVAAFSLMTLHIITKAGIIRYVWCNDVSSVEIVENTLDIIITRLLLFLNRQQYWNFTSKNITLYIYNT